MKRVMSGICFAVCLGSVAFAQQTPGPSYEHLKSFDQLIGSWTHKGPISEPVPGFGEKGSTIVLRASWKWVLDKNAIEGEWSVEFAGGATMSGKTLTGWDAREQQMIGVGMDNGGAHSLNVTTYDPEAKSWMVKSSGADGEGKTLTSIVVFTLKNANTATFQETERNGEPVEEKSEKITLTRDTSTGRPEAVKAIAKPPALDDE